jgi:hypothetical protein
LIFSTLTFSDKIPPKDWHYYSFETGQHITFYQPRTLALLSKKLEINYYMVAPDMHIMTDIDLSRWERFLLFNKYLRKIYALYVRWKRQGVSKNWNDYLLLKEKAKLSINGSHNFTDVHH